ncbi:MAG: hypothetical protein LBI06_02285 [Treponema sp.]|jgi:hypothetical protein|nr:hypothetical protein [Treponema sp.]
MEESVQNQIARLATLKLKPYKKFIKTLLRIEGQGIVMDKDYRKLRALFQGQIALYLKKENAQTIAASLMTIGRCVGMGNENFRLRETLRTPVFAIIDMLMENMGLGGRLDETLIKELGKAEDAFFPQLFRQAVKEALDNVLVNHSDYCVLNRGEYIQQKDGEYIVFPFINEYPYGCKIMIGPFTNEASEEILFQLYVPKYIPIAVSELNTSKWEISSFVNVCVEGQEMPPSVSMPLNNSCLIELEQEDCNNDYIPSFSFDDRDSFLPYRRNYDEIAFALGQRAKYIFLNACVSLEGMYMYKYILKLEKIDSSAIYPDIPWTLTESGDLAT